MYPSVVAVFSAFGGRAAATPTLSSASTSLTSSSSYLSSSSEHLPAPQQLNQGSLAPAISGLNAADAARSVL